ncbi:MAG TPA: permease prefix domain 1-containing protein, partial [Planctomycetaceae bacterium]|nr:permease prefix domain 1-containing protein [Planctomycetaceae bacterium]
MEWPDDLAAELPGPNPDEPQSLRQDILDELRDHLQSSLELEQLKGTPASEAERAVITKFGNPVQTARQLWWDAMKGRIMSQRITLGLVIVLCLLSVAATAMLWQTVQQGQQTTAALIAK